MLPSHSSDDEEVIKRRQEAKLVADLIEQKEKESKRHRHKKSKRKHKRYDVMFIRGSHKCVLMYYPLVIRRREKSSESGSMEEVEDEKEGVWVEKTVQRDVDTAFVGPVPEIKVQATVTKKE